MAARRRGTGHNGLRRISRRDVSRGPEIGAAGIGGGAIMIGLIPAGVAEAVIGRSGPGGRRG